MKLILAPMATLSHEAFRRCVERFGGCDEYFTEMINAGSLIHMGPFEKYYLLSGPVPQKIVWQITGSRADYMAHAASVVAQQEGIGVDLNMGCSAPQIANTGAGISWMTKPAAETQKMVHDVKSALENAAKDGQKSKRLSVKLRLGDENFTEEKLFAFTDMLTAEGVEMLTLHPRTKKEKYREHARWHFVEKLALRYPGIPVILNGDVKDRATFEEAVKTAPHAAGVMVARAAAQKPWIFREIASPLSENTALTIDCEKLALDFISDVEECQPEEFWKTRLQRFFAYYCLNFSFAHYFQTQMLNSKDNDDARKRVREYFEKCPDDRELVIQASGL
ncbi:MAG: tRNA-dihydrouridine synthase family protein [Treponema sp.]|nr:tRNA-dihydrouridine synthase family protein [Treponema sp.]